MEPLLVHHTKREVAAALIRSAIIRGEFPPGARLPLQELAERFDLSLTPVREAFQLLEAEGFVRQHAHKGAVVAPLDLEELEELYAMRSAVEGLAVRNAVPRLKSGDLEELDAAVARMESFAGEWEDFLPLDRYFHRYLYSAAGRPRWVATIETLWRRSLRFMLSSSAVMGRGSLDEDHRDLLTACHSADAQRAEAIVHAHLDKARQHLLAIPELTKETLSARDTD